MAKYLVTCAIDVAGQRTNATAVVEAGSIHAAVDALPEDFLAELQDEEPESVTMMRLEVVKQA